MLLVNLAAPDSAAYQSIFLWSLALIGLLLVGFFVVMKVKARMREPEQPVTVGFSLSDLRKLHQSGQLSDEEYERARGKMVAAMQKEQKPGDAAKRDGGSSASSSDEWVERARARRRAREGEQKTEDQEPDEGMADR